LRASAARAGASCNARFLYLGEINDNQREAWCRVIEGFEEEAGQSRQLALFPPNRDLPDHATGYGIQIHLGQMQLHRPANGAPAGWPASSMSNLGLDSFFQACLPPSREGTPWHQILQTLVCYRPIDPGSEWRLHRH
jgi:hypothetical protein